MKITNKRSILFITAVILFIAGCLFLLKQPAKTSGSEVTAAGVQSDVIRTEEHEAITWDLIEMAEHDAEFKRLLEQSVAQAAKLNPDSDTNPVQDLESYYQFLDRCYTAMPWEINPSGSFSSLYERIDQGMGCLYFVCDQPLKELEDRGYYHNSILYHEPFRSWFIRYLSGSGSFLNSDAS